MNPTVTECPNCHTPLKSGMFSVVALLDEPKTNLINAVNDTRTAGYCNKCGDPLYSQARQKIAGEIEQVKDALWKAITYMPVISAQSPLGWEYEVLTMVTGQSTTGTGVFSEFTSSITDLFGAQSGSYNRKLKVGEQLCFTQLRKQTLDLGGNAVIATDIDYSEVGGDKGMLMVCMAGTAIRLTNPQVLGQTRMDKLSEIPTMYERLRTLRALEKTD